MASGQDIDKQDGIDTSNFYIELGTAQVCISNVYVDFINMRLFNLH